MAQERVRVIFDTTDRVRRALELRTFRLRVERGQKVSLSEYLTEHLESVLADELAEVDRLSGAEKPPTRKRKSGTPQP